MLFSNICTNTLLLNKEVIMEQLQEGVKWKYVIRDGKKVKKPYTDRDGYKISYKDGKPIEKKMTPQEIQRKRKSAKKSAKKKVSKKSQISKKIQKSKKKHTWEDAKLTPYKRRYFEVSPVGGIMSIYKTLPEPKKQLVKKTLKKSREGCAEAEYDLVISLAKQGIKVDDICSQTGCSKFNVMFILNIAGVKYKEEEQRYEF